MAPKPTLIHGKDLQEVEGEHWVVTDNKANIANFNTLVKVEYTSRGVESLIRLTCKSCNKTYTATNFGASLKSKVAAMINHLYKKENIESTVLLSRFPIYEHIFNNTELYLTTE